MTPTLRTWHRLLWPLLTIVMIALGIFAMQAFPGTSYIPAPVHAAEGIDGVNAELQAASAAGQAHVKLSLKAPLSAATTLIYIAPKATENPADGRLLGRVDGRGDYRFPLSQETAAFTQKYLLGFDPIYNQLIFQIPLDK